jgi:molybdopterin converting factor small subunit
MFSIGRKVTLMEKKRKTELELEANQQVLDKLVQKGVQLKMELNHAF